MTRRLTHRLLLLLTVSGSAHASCTIQQAQLNLPEYTALRDTPGSLNILVRCDTPQDRTTLRLSAASLHASSPEDLTLTLQGGAAALQVTLLTAAPLLGGLPLTGTQVLHFPVLAPRGQWLPTGDYTLPLTLFLDSPLP